MWIIYALCSALFAGLTAVLAKCGLQETDSTVATAVRTIIVLLMAWLMVFITGKQSMVKHISSKELLYLGLSGIATGASWLCYYKALKDGRASVVVPIDKLSVLVTVAFSCLIFREHLSPKAAIGLLLITAGTLLMTFS